MTLRSRLATSPARTVPVAKVFGPGVPPQIEAAEARAQMTPGSPFGPGTPIGPYDGYSRQPRSQDFVTGVNIATRPRTHERVSFETLKGLMGSYDVADICVWHRIDSIRALDWKLISADGFSGDATDAIALGMKALEKPDRIHYFETWLGKWLYDVLAYDAGVLYRLRNRGGRCIGLLPIDGTSIAPLLDYWGNPPGAMAAPGEALPEAYVQYVNGLPWNWLNRDDLVYEPYRMHNDSLYGRAPIETILLNANTDIRFQLYFLQRFTEGNLPAAFASAPESWSPDQIEQFQELWDGFMLGDQSRKSQIRWLPPGSKFTWSNEKDFTDAFSLFLMRKTAAAFHVVPSDLGFTESVNKSSGESQGDVSHRVGDAPFIRYIQRILSSFLQCDLGLPLKFAFDLGEEQDDRVNQATADKMYSEMGAIGVSELREMRYGLTDPVPVPRYIFTERAGPIPIASLLAVAGEIDAATGLPVPGSPLPKEVFGGTEGVLPNPPIKVMSLAEREFGEAAMPPAPPPQPKMTPAQAVPDDDDSQDTVAKEGEAAGGNVTAGITAETGLYSYDLDGRDDDEEEAAVAKELAAFRRFAKARRKAGQWRDFEFAAVSSADARRLNAEGSAAVRKAASGYEISPRSGMISLDLPPGTLLPLPGGVDDHHVTVVYLGPDVDDDAFAAACVRAASAAASVPGPLSGTVSGVGCFPPSGSSDGKVPAWAAIAIPGAEKLRDALADLSASEHRDWTPHVTLAYLDPGDPLPAPLEPVPVTFTHLSVHRGEDVVRYPLGGGGDVAKAASDDPKAPAPSGSAPDWHGWKLDQKTAAYWAPKVRDSVKAAIPRETARQIGADYLADHPQQDGKATGKRDRNKAAAAWLAAWLARQNITLVPASLTQAIAADGYMIGAASAASAVSGDPADTGDWQPGDTSSAQKRIAELGMAATLLALLGRGGQADGAAAEEAAAAGEPITSGYLGSLAIVLAGTDADWADSQDTLDDLGDTLSSALADEDTAVTLIGSQINIFSGLAAQAYYLANTVSLLSWVTEGDARVCPRCAVNAAASPLPAGTPFPSGDLYPPAHPSCRCAIWPADMAAAPGTPNAPGEGEGDAGEAGDDAEDAEDDDADETAGEDSEDAPEEAPDDSPEFSPLEFSSDRDARAWTEEHTPDLPAAQAEAVNWYTGPGAYEANESLRSGAELPAEVAAQVAALDAAMAPLPAGLVLTRGVYLEGFPGGGNPAALAGQLITDQAFMSTSLGGEVAKDVGGDMTMHIAAPQGTMAVITGTLSDAQAQREIVLARGTQLAVSQVAQDADGQWEMWLTVVQGE